MEGIFVKIDRNDIKEMVEEMLESNASFVELSSSTSQLVKLRKKKLKLQRDFLMKTEELGLEIDKINSFMPSFEISSKRISKPILEVGTRKIAKATRKTKYEAELEEIRKRLEELRQR
jgi:hypothetical protein